LGEELAVVIIPSIFTDFAARAKSNYQAEFGKKTGKAHNRISTVTQFRGI
jgi:hypothetical protein